jgi:hypothetical protein
VWLKCSLFLLLFLPIQLSAQTHYLLSALDALKDNNRVILTWTIKKGNSCIGITIYRSVDNVNFKKIGEIQGACGSTEYAQSYLFIDESPIKNRTNYYSLELGFSGRTEPSLAVQFIDFSQKKSVVLPNPVTSNGKIHIENPDHQKRNLFIFNKSGQKIYEDNSNNEFFPISLSQLNDQFSSLTTFFYLITDQFGKFVDSGPILIGNQ